MKITPHKYQQASLNFVLDRLEEGEGAGLFLDPGLGKTLISLMAIDWLRSTGQVRKVLIVAPLRVAYQVWPKEIAKWGFNLSYEIVHGTPQARSKALRQNVDVYITNVDGVKFLQRAKTIPKFDLVIFDESTAFKTWMSQRSRAARKLIAKIPKRIILTGTPAANSYVDLLGQIFLLDGGERLGKTKGFFLNQFGAIQVRQFGDPEIGMIGRQRIDKLIAPICLRLDAESNLDMPELLVNDVWVDLEPEVQSAYKKLEKELFLALDSGESIYADSAGAKYAKCKTLANGGVYAIDELNQRQTHHIHDTKIQAAKEIVDSLSGKPVVIAYPFQQDLDRLKRAFPKAPVIAGGDDPKELTKLVDRFRAGRVPVLLVQPLAMSHGIDGLQEASSDLIWLGLSDRPELSKQLNARIYRQGACANQVRIHRILARDTIDVAIAKRLDNKAETQEALFDALKEYRNG